MKRVSFPPTASLWHRRRLLRDVEGRRSLSTCGLYSTSRIRGHSWTTLSVLFLIIAFAPCWAVQADRIGDLTGNRWQDQAARFIRGQDPAVRHAVTGTLLLGISCGILGSFLVVRRMALVGDAISHAVLPGVALGFLWNISKDPWAIFIGATVAGLLGTATVTAITRTTKLKEDTALGMVLASFFGVGITLVTYIQGLPTGNQSGIDSFLFGQAAAIGPDDLILMALVTFAVVFTVGFAYKELLLVSFDPGFAHVCSLPTRWINHTFMLLLSFTIVIALQAVGVVLVSAMLITPAATAFLLTDRFHRMIFISAALGVVSGIIGAFLSFLAPNLPTGPCIVLTASSIFVTAFLFAPRMGVVTRWLKHTNRRRRIARENTLKAVYHTLEADAFVRNSISLRQLAERRRRTLEEVEADVRALVSHELATVQDDSLVLTPQGWERACTIVRNHRLWELYLTHAAQIAPDHVHDDAEHIEHVLGEDVVRSLERRLQFADTDPHGKPIPGLHRIHEQEAAATRPEPPSGYQRPRP